MLMHSVQMKSRKMSADDLTYTSATDAKRVHDITCNVYTECQIQNVIIHRHIFASVKCLF